MAKIENNSINYMTDSISAEKTSKIDKMKQEQKSRAASLFDKLEEQRKVYDETKKTYYETKFQTYVLKNRTERYETNNFLKDKYQEKYENSEVSLKGARKSRDAELRRLESYTDAFCSANSVSIFSL